MKLVKFYHDTINLILGRKSGDASGHSRGYLWKETIKRMMMRPIFGFGPFGFTGKYEIINIGLIDSPHNEFLQRGAYTGIPGLLMYLIALFLLYKNYIKKISESTPSIMVAIGIVTVYLWSSCFGNPFFNTIVFFYLFLGVSSSALTPEQSCILIPDENIIEIKNKFLTKRVKIALPILCVITVIASLISNSIGAKLAEPVSERADIAIMEAAAASGKMMSKDLIKNGKYNDTKVYEYWFDSASNSLIPTDSMKPTSYGCGTEIDGGVENNTGFHYATNESYVDKIVKVTLTPNSEKKYDVSIEWVYVLLNDYEKGTISSQGIN